jgi:hypothetical protein
MHGGAIFNSFAYGILVDPGAFAEVNTSGVSFNYSGKDTVYGSIHFSGTDDHFENNNAGVHWFNCAGGGCSIHVKGGSAYLLGKLTSADAFGNFAGSNNQAIFDGVEWGIGSGNSLSQFFIWNDSSASSNLNFNHFRQGLVGLLSTTSLASVPVYSTSGSPPAIFRSDTTLGGIPGTKFLASCGSMTTTASASDAISCSWVTASSVCTVTPSNSTSVAWSYFVPTAGSVTVYHAPTAGATYAIACSAN